MDIGPLFVQMRSVEFKMINGIIGLIMPELRNVDKLKLPGEDIDEFFELIVNVRGPIKLQDENYPPGD